MNIAVFLAASISPVLGDMFKAFNAEYHRLSCRRQGFTAPVYGGYLLAALKQVDARATDVAAGSGRRLAAGSSSLAA